MSFKKIAYNVGDFFEMLVFDGNKKFNFENTRKAFKKWKILQIFFVFEKSQFWAAVAGIT